MLLKGGLVLMMGWAVLGVLGIDHIGKALHALMLIGWMLLLLGFLKARDAAKSHEQESKPPRER